MKRPNKLFITIAQLLYITSCVNWQKRQRCHLCGCVNVWDRSRPGQSLPGMNRAAVDGLRSLYPSGQAGTGPKYYSVSLCDQILSCASIKHIIHKSRNNTTTQWHTSVCSYKTLKKQEIIASYCFCLMSNREHFFIFYQRKWDQEGNGSIAHSLCHTFCKHFRFAYVRRASAQHYIYRCGHTLWPHAARLLCQLL